MNSQIVLKDLVLIGGGHAHVHTIKMFGMNPMPGVRVTLISRDIDTPYSGMLPGQVAGLYTHDESHIDLVRLTSFASVRFLHCEASGLDVENKKIYCNDGRPPIRYDVLSIDIGITPKTLDNGMGNFSNITPVKPIDRFARRWKMIMNRVLSDDSSNTSRKLRVAIVGGGAGGCELCFAIHFRLTNELVAAKRDPRLLEVILITKADKILSGHSKRAQLVAEKILNQKGIRVIYNCDITSCVSSDAISPPSQDTVAGSRILPRASRLVSATGDEIDFDECFWCTQAIAQSWLKETGLQTTEEGFICVSSSLESTNVPGVFACGDVAHLTETPRPKAGVFAVRAGPPLTRNLRCKLLGTSSLEQWTPQDLFLGLIGTFGVGTEVDAHWGNYAIGSKGGLVLAGAHVWQLKDKIDRDFMALFQVLPDKEEMMKKMKPVAEIIPEVATSMGSNVLELFAKSKMRCGGCGSKVGSTLLSRVLKQIQQSIRRNKSVVSGVGGGDDAAIVIPPPEGSYAVHTIDYFRSFLSDPFLFGKIAANHALSDAFAMNAEATSALALCVVPYGAEEKVEDELLHMLAGCVNVLESVGCSLVGGHTSEGAEPALGLSVNGSVKPASILRKGPLRDGDVIVLTKGLGTGTILAADMRAKAKGSWVYGALQSMLLSNQTAASILREHGCLAATDVTGFGFMGHLLEMVKFTEEESDGSRSSPCTVTLNVKNIPLLVGAVECIEQGVLSSLQPQNIRSARAVGNVHQFVDSSVYPLLFDPQTSGGLLASIPRASSPSALRALHAAGYADAAIIGYVEAAYESRIGSSFKIGKVQSDETKPLVWLE